MRSIKRDIENTSGFHILSSLNISMNDSFIENNNSCFRNDYTNCRRYDKLQPATAFCSSNGFSSIALATVSNIICYGAFSALSNNSFTSILTQNTSSTFLLPEGKPILPSGKIELPSGKMGLPLGKIGLPSGKMELPSGKIDLPLGKMGLPSGKIDLPSGKIGLPSLLGDLPEAFSGFFFIKSKTLLASKFTFQYNFS